MSHGSTKRIDVGTVHRDLMMEFMSLHSVFLSARGSVGTIKYVSPKGAQFVKSTTLCAIAHAESSSLLQSRCKAPDSMCCSPAI